MPLKWPWSHVTHDDDRPHEADQLVVLGTPFGEALAGLWQTTLESANIHSMVRNVNSLAVYGVPELEVLVHQNDLEAAKRLLGLDDEDGVADKS